MADWVTGGLVPPVELLPDVLPTDRLSATGMPVPSVRAELRRIPTARNVITIAGVWVQVALVIGGAIWLSHPLAWAAAFVLMGRNFALMAILGHEASHRLLLPHRAINDFVGRWLSYYPSLTAYDVYRRAHAAHHREEFGPGEPDMNFYAGYPVGWASMRRKFTRDVLGITGARNLRGLFSALRSSTARPVALKILASQAMVLAVLTILGRPELYLFLWLLPWLTVWKVLNRLRAIAEHGGMHKSGDRRETTHHVHQSWLPRFWFAPYNTGWHLAHHVDSGVPFRNLPRLERELEEAGYVPDALIWPSYTSLWWAMARGRPALAVQN